MTQLCTIPGCRIRGRHKPDCADDTCDGCLPRVASEGLACDVCIGRAAAQLEAIADLASDALDAARRLGGNQSGGGTPGKPGSRLPLDLGALARLDGVANALGTWTRHVVEERGLYPPHLPPGAPVVAPTARFLLEHLPWFRHRLEIDELLRDVAASVRIVRGILDPAREQKYLGPCGAQFDIATYAEPDRVLTCEGDVYGYAGAATGTCRTCGAQVDQAERRRWLDDEVRGYDYTPQEISAAYPEIKRNTINQWASRGRITARGQHGNSALYNLGEVLDLAAGEAARREERRAERGAPS